MSSEMYVVMRIGYEYNDEVMFKPENGGGHPDKVFNTLSKANKAADLANLEEFRELLDNGQIVDYGYSLEDIIDHPIDPKADKVFNKVFGKSVKDWHEAACDGFRWENKKMFVGTPSDKDLINVINCFNFTFYEVVAVTKG